jgi:hypothetical protein
MRPNDNLIIVMSRKNYPSYHASMARVPGYLNKYFRQHNFILIYPMQAGADDGVDVDLKNPSMMEPMERLDDFGRTVAQLFRLR